eukprot:49735-Eustigmatos_ZCMA.PRE.1
MRLLSSNQDAALAESKDKDAICAHQAEELMKAQAKLAEYEACMASLLNEKDALVAAKLHQKEEECAAQAQELVATRAQTQQQQMAI